MLSRPSIIALAFVALVAAAGARALAAPTPLELSVFRFYTSRDLNNAHVAVYRQETDGLFTPYNIGDLNMRALDPAQPCDTLLTNLESFSLATMKNLGYLDDLSLAAQVAAAEHIRPEQVTILEMTRPVPERMREEHPEWVKEGRFSVRPDPEGKPLAHLKTAALRIVSGQSGYPHSQLEYLKNFGGAVGMPALPWQSTMNVMAQGKAPDMNTIGIALTPMPWQLNPALNFGKHGYYDLDRSKYPMVWELGRAAQIEVRHVATMMQAGLAIVAEDIEVSMQGDPKDAHLFVHALDPVRKRLFERAGFKPLPGACPSPNDCVLTAPFSTIAAKYPPGKHSKRLAEILKLLPAGTPVEIAMNLLRRAHAHLRAELDFHVPGFEQDTPLVVHDTSRNYYLTLQALAMRMGATPENADKLVLLLDSYRTDSGRTKRPEIFDEPHVDQFIHGLYDANAIRVANVDPRLAMRPQYWGSMIEGVHQYMEQRYREMDVANPEEVYDIARPRIVVQTTDQLVAWAAETFSQRFGGVAGHPIRGSEGKVIYTVVFDYEARERLRAEIPMLAEAVKDKLSQGYWFFRRITAHPMKF